MMDNVFKAPSLPPGPRRRDPNPQSQYGLITSNEPPDDFKPETDGTQPTETPVAQAQPVEADRAFDPPFWCKRSPHKFGFEVIKNGVIVETIDLSIRDHWILGRLPPPIVDLSLDNPTVSRQHAAIAFRDTGEAYVYDLGSVHGTCVNKKQIKAKTYVELRTGDQLKFGQSSRFYVLIGGPEISEPRLSPEESRALQEKKQRALVLVRDRRSAETAELIRQAKQNDDGEATEDDDAMQKEHEETEQSDSVVEERSIRAREFYRQYYGDEEEDEADAFLDRTVDVERRRRSRSNQTESFESLSAKFECLESLRQQLVAEIHGLDQTKATGASAEGDDDLDQFMAGLAGSFDQEKKMKKENLSKEIEQELWRLRQLIELVKPSSSISSVQKLTPNQKRSVVEFEADWITRAAETGTVVPKAATKDIFIQDEYEPAPKRLKLEDSRGTTPQVNSPNPAVDRGTSSLPSPPPRATNVTTGALMTKPKPKQKQKPDSENATLEGEDDEWVPPPQQTGDGRTDLNSKLGY